MARITTKGDTSNILAVGAPSISWGPAYPFVPPVDAQFSWVNQGSATITDLGDALTLAGPAGGTNSLRIRQKATPATPYVIEIVFMCRMGPATAMTAGFCWRESSSGKLTTWGIGPTVGSTITLFASKWTNETTFNSNYSAPNAGMGWNIMFFKAFDNGTNRGLSFSADGQVYNGIMTDVARTDFMTPDQVGFWCTTTDVNIGPEMTVLSWKES